MARHKVFYSFHYKPDNWRAAQVRNISSVVGNTPVSQSAWEKVTQGGDAAIENWVEEQMKGRCCTVVLIGSKTAHRPWITYEIVKSWEAGMGVVGLHIHGLSNFTGKIAPKGKNPFEFPMRIGNDKVFLSKLVKCYDPPGNRSHQRFSWISQNLKVAIEEAIGIRRKH